MKELPIYIDDSEIGTGEFSSSELDNLIQQLIEEMYVDEEINPNKGIDINNTMKKDTLLA
jgi:hypothetical protein